MPLELLWFLTLLSVHVELVIGQVISFITTPMNVSANELETVTLTCTINHTTIYYRYHWSKNGVEISEQTDIYTDTTSELGIDTNRYSIHTSYSEDHGVVRYDHTLRILTVQHNYAAPDSGVYAFYVNDITNGEHGIEILRSDDVHLVVRKDPPITDPECITDVPTTVREVEEVSLGCTTEKGNPEVTLKWSVKGDTVRVLNTMLSLSVSMLNLSYVWSPRYTEQGIIFTCTARRSSPYDLDRSCEVGPLDIQYQPKVFLQQVDIGQGSDSEMQTFTCHWFANPNVDDILWYFENFVIDGSQGRYVISTRDNFSILTITSVTGADQHAQVGCEVSNQIGVTRESIFFIIATTANQATSSTPTVSASDIHHQNSLWPSSDITDVFATSTVELRSHQSTNNNTAVPVMGVLLGLFSVTIGILTFFLYKACRRIRNLVTEQQGTRSYSADYVISNIKVPNRDPASGKDSKHDNDMKDADIYDKIKETSMIEKDVPDVIDKEGYAELVHHHGDSGQGENTHLYTGLTNKL